MLTFLYHTAFGRMLLKILCQPKLSALVGRFLDSRASLPLIRPFVRNNHIDLSEYESGFSCFNDCFCRKIKPGLRVFEKDGAALCAPCDGYLSAYRISDRTVLGVKQSRYTITDLLQDEDLADRFTDGLCLVFRLCVNHYHRYTYFDDCKKGENVAIPGILHPVRPVALSAYPVFVQNSREYTVMETAHFGTAVQIEVGALLVGKIHNLHGEGDYVRGAEKGCFLYGGSTIILLLEKGAASLISPFAKTLGTGREIPVQMGEKIGTSEIFPNIKQNVT